MGQTSTQHREHTYTYTYTHTQPRRTENTHLHKCRMPTRELSLMQPRSQKIQVLRVLPWFPTQPRRSERCFLRADHSPNMQLKCQSDNHYNLFCQYTLGTAIHMLRTFSAGCGMSFAATQRLVRDPESASARCEPLVVAAAVVCHSVAVVAVADRVPCRKH